MHYPLLGESGMKLQENASTKNLNPESGVTTEYLFGETSSGTG
jgi:hypothetical protein